MSLKGGYCNKPEDTVTSCKPVAIISFFFPTLTPTLLLPQHLTGTGENGENGETGETLKQKKSYVPHPPVVLLCAQSNKCCPVVSSKM
jgi:hypothetical protein